MNKMKKSLYTVVVFAKLNTLRYFRDKTAIFFTALFPLIFLFVFGTIYGGNSSVSFRVALINQSDSSIAKTFSEELRKSSILSVNDKVTDLQAAEEKMNRAELDAALIIPQDFGNVLPGSQTPSGNLQVYYSQNNAQAAQTLVPALQSAMTALNGQFVQTVMPFTVQPQQTGSKGLSGFDYAFAGLLGFSLLSLSIFGPVNAFPELKKQGILRRFSTTPIRVWQYFVANATSQVVIGMFTMAVMFTAAIVGFKLNLAGNIFELALFIMLSIVTLLGIGLAIGGWAKNERQAAPIANLVTFPMMFLSGTFFPRYIMPEWLQQVSAYLPLTPIIDGIRLITTEGKHLIDILPQIGLISVWMIIIYVIAFRVFRWE